MNKEESQNEIMNQVLNGHIDVQLIPYYHKITFWKLYPDNPTCNEEKLIYEGTLAYDGTVDNNLRYIGSNPANYVTFNNELWRIIGWMNNIDDGKGTKETRIKLIRNESIGNYSWDTSVSNNGYGVNEWSEADLMKLLNPGYESISIGGSLYWNKKSGNCYNGRYNAYTSCNFTNHGLNNDSKNMIGEAIWNLGEISYNRKL